jgi:hypothetical protein
MYFPYICLINIMVLKRKTIPISIAVLTILFNAFHACAQKDPCAYLKNIVYFLASDSLKGRAAGSIYELKAAKFIASEFKSDGLKRLTKKNYFQTFEFPFDSLHMDTSRNVIGWINNHAGKTIVIGAHYDHIGMGGRYSRSIGKKAVHPGADDNASGVAIMLDLARWLTKEKSGKYNYCLVAFGSHEVGLFGSKYFVKSNIVDTANIALMINLDMVGRFDTISKILICEGTVSYLADSTVSLCGIAGFVIKHRDITMGDHSPFLQQHIPVLRFTTGTHDDYHSINDKAENINYSGLVTLDFYLRKLIGTINKFDFITIPD